MNWKNSRVLVFVLMVVLLLAACGGDENYAMDEANYAYEESAASAPMADMAEMEEAAFRSDTATTSQTDGLEQSQERLIIRTGNLSIVVLDTETAVSQIADMVEANGGWVVSSNLYKYSETAKTGDITVRVPASGYNSSFEAMKALALEVTNESSSGQDVTDEYVDLASRLGNLEATADRVRGFLDETENVEEALAVNMELSRLEGEIEVIKGRMEYLSKSAAFSTISVHLTPDEQSQPIELAGWQPKGVAKDALESLLGALQGLVSFLIWFVIYALPLLLIIGVPVWLFVRFVRGRIRRRRQGKTDTVTPPTK